MTEPHAYTLKQRRLTLVSVLIVFALSAVSQTVVGTAMPRIVAELSGLELYAWATTAYLLSSTVTVPIWGKLGDLYGRKPVLIAGISIFLTGSWLGGLSGELATLPLLGGGMTQLIAFRALQGLGGGALFTTAFAIIAELYAPRERAQFSGLFGSIFGLASVFGPVIGGFLTDHGSVTLLHHHIAGWRWVFYINVPFAVCALAMIQLKMPTLPPRGKGGVDWLGSGLIVLAFVPLLLAVTWGGQQYPWASAIVMGLFALALVSLATFVIVEKRVRDPILPLEMFRNRTFTTANTASFVYSIAFMGTTAFLPLFMQVGQGVPATKSGLTMLALMVGIISSSTVSGQIVTRTGKFKPCMVAGGFAVLAGALSLCFIGPDTGTADLACRLLLLGVGMGPGLSLFSVAVQNAVPFHQLGVATSTGQFVRQIGSTLGVALFGALLTSGLSAELGRHQVKTPGAAVHQLGLADLQKMALHRNRPPTTGVPSAARPQIAAQEQIIRTSFSTAIHHGMLFSLFMLIAGFLLMLMIPGVDLQDRPRGRSAAEGSSQPDEGAALAAEAAGEELKL